MKTAKSVSKSVVVLVTAKNLDEARKIAGHLLAKKLIACANIVNGVESHFWWEGKIDKSAEVLLLLKSQQSLFPKIVKAVKDAHSYSVPEIIALPIILGDKNYLDWIKKETR